MFDYLKITEDMDWQRQGKGYKLSSLRLFQKLELSQLGSKVIWVWVAATHEDIASAESLLGWGIRENSWQTLKTRQAVMYQPFKPSGKVTASPWSWMSGVWGNMFLLIESSQDRGQGTAASSEMRKAEFNRIGTAVTSPHDFLNDWFFPCVWEGSGTSFIWQVH